MIGLSLLQRQEPPRAQRIGRAPRHRPFRLEAFDVADHQHPEVAARRQRRSADPIGVELRALLLDEGVEARLVEHAAQAERVARRLRQVRVGHPHRRLPRTSAAFAYRHWYQCTDRDRALRLSACGPRSRVAENTSYMAARLWIPGRPRPTHKYSIGITSPHHCGTSSDVTMV